MVVCRLAPSPTGAQHLGNARTYLAAHWSAMRQNATMILRIEDIDSPRVKSWAVDQAIEDLRWLGIRWHCGPDVGGVHQPYIQTQRTPLYADAVERLLNMGRTYPCTCTRKDIEQAASAPHANEGPPIYPGTCRGWKLGDPLPEEGTYCWRFRVKDQRASFRDQVVGERSMNPFQQLGDFPITRKSGDPAYQLAVVVDDAAMGVTEVVRGDDLLESTHWQVELYESLGLALPRFVHLPLVVGPDGRRLAKRHGDTRLSHLRDRGIDPREIIRWAGESLGMPQVPTGDVDIADMHRHFSTNLSWSDLDRHRVVVPSEWTAI